MSREVFVRGKKIRLEPSKILGQGGEADVFDVRDFFPGEPPFALKLWKGADHPDYEGKDSDAKRNRESAKLRLTEYAQKLAVFPKSLPSRVVTPQDVALNRAAGQVVGYIMALLEGTSALRQYMNRTFRQKAGVDIGQMIQIFQDLFRTVETLHQRGIVIGDFNYLNVLVRGLEAHIIDADSMQFGPYHCRSYTTRFVDPLVCDPTQTKPVQLRPHSANTDWYAFALMLFEALLFVHPYGGVYEPKDPTNQVPPDSRPLKRISVLNPEVVYPVKGTPLSWLPSPVANFYGDLLAHDRRGVFPMNLLEVLKAHAAGKYIDPATIVAPIRKRETIRGGASSKRYFEIHGGAIVAAAFHYGKLRLLTHKGGEFAREDGTPVLNGALSPDLKYRISGNRTLLGLGRQLAVFSPGKPPAQHPVDLFQGRRPVFDGNAQHYYWLSGGQLYRDDTLGPRFVGNVLENQTLFWVGPTFGFGFYRASTSATSGMTAGFVFDAERGGLNDSVRLPNLRGELVDAACYFSSQRAWFLTATLEGGKVINRCVAISPDGAVSNSAQAEEDDGTWLGSIRGKCAGTVRDSHGQPAHRLFSGTDRGLVAVDEVSGHIIDSARYPDTKGFVDGDDRLFLDQAGGLFVIDSDEVRLVKFAL